jgi:hypothetical protein
MSKSNGISNIATLEGHHTLTDNELALQRRPAEIFGHL